MKELILSSPAFVPEGWIPRENSGYGVDKSPELRLCNMAENAVSLAVTLEDLGHPIQPGYPHWVVWNLPPVSVIPENLPRGAVVEQPFHFEQGLAYGRHRYRGPKPPFNWNHRYRFTVYVLDSTLTLPADADRAALLRAMNGHVLQTACLFGKFQRHPTCK